MRISVIVPSFKREDALERCLDALARQRVAADELIVVARADDTATLERVHAWHHRHPECVLLVPLIDEPGVVAAYNRGLDTASGDIICFTDDDAAPHVDWLERVRNAFIAYPRAGGIGGRDVNFRNGRPVLGNEARVGLISWYGRMVGNHHVGGGTARQVMVLKGVNMCWRRAAIEGLRFDARLRGAGAQVHCELAFSLAVARRGWKLIYDPWILVDHFHAVRADYDQRDSFNEIAFFNAAFNLRLVLYESMSPLRRVVFLMYAVLFGSRDDPGVVRALKLALDADGFSLAFHKWRLAMRAMRAAHREAVRHPPRLA